MNMPTHAHDGWMRRLGSAKIAYVWYGGARVYEVYVGPPAVRFPFRAASFPPVFLARDGRRLHPRPADVWTDPFEALEFVRNSMAREILYLSQEERRAWGLPYNLPPGWTKPIAEQLSLLPKDTA